MNSTRYPRKEALLLAWARYHADLWAGGQAGPPDTGLAAQQLVDFENAVASAEASFANRTAKLAAAKAATTSKKDAFSTLHSRLGSCMATIDAYVKQTQDPQVYVRAEIDPPKDPSERPAPPKPVELDLLSYPDGSLRLTFKVTASGSVFEIQRMTTAIGGAEGPWTTISITGDKMFTDLGVPVGLRSIQYRVRAVLPNGNSSEWSTPVPFSFGSQGSQGGPAAAQGAA